jgi:hypothetical protein
MGTGAAALPPKADVQRLDINPELLADFGRMRNGGFRMVVRSKRT